MGESMIPSGFLAFLLLYFVFSSHFLSSNGASNFTQLPNNTVVVISPDTIKLEWNYTVDNKNEFKDNSPVWEYKGSSGIWQKIASEDGLDGWKWKISSECPKTLRPRVSKESVATLVIINTTREDSGHYRCTLKLLSSDDIPSEVEVIVNDPIASSTPPSTPVTVNGSTPPPSTTKAVPTTKPTTTPAKEPCPDYPYEAIVEIGVTPITVDPDYLDWSKDKISEFFKKDPLFCDINVKKNDKSLTITLVSKDKVTKEDVRRKVEAFAKTVEGDVEINILSVEIKRPPLRPAEIAGIVIAVVVLIAVIVIVIVVVIKKKKNRKRGNPVMLQKVKE